MLRIGKWVKCTLSSNQKIVYWLKQVDRGTSFECVRSCNIYPKQIWIVSYFLLLHILSKLYVLLKSLCYLNILFMQTMITHSWFPISSTYITEFVFAPACHMVASFTSLYHMFTFIALFHSFLLHLFDICRFILITDFIFGTCLSLMHSNFTNFALMNFAFWTNKIISIHLNWVSTGFTTSSNAEEPIFLRLHCIF